MDIDINYELEKVGWSKCELKIEKQSLEMTDISYLSDALWDLVNSYNCLLKGENTKDVFFAGEPTGYSWIFEKLDTDRITIKIFLNTWDEELEIHRDKVLLESECLIIDFGQALYQCLEEILKTYGLDEYKKVCGEYEFPFFEYRELKDLLDNLKFVR